MTAAWAKAKQILYWSWSTLSIYRLCPRKAKYKVIDKLKEPGSPALDKGNAVHKAGELYMRGAYDEVPEQFLLFKKEMIAFKKAGAKPEVSWAWDNQWVRCKSDDFARAWLRIKIDLQHWNAKTKTLTIIDYKTGKDHSEDDDNKEQMRLYFLGALLTYPDAKKVITELWYLEHFTRARQEYIVKPGTLEAEKKYWGKQVAKMLSDKVVEDEDGKRLAGFEATPSAFACRYCHYRKANGGPCEN
jgi:hypothetical protein